MKTNMGERDESGVACTHCWHAFHGAYMRVLHSGEILQECCKCRARRTIHRDHAHDA